MFCAFPGVVPAALAEDAKHSCSADAHACAAQSKSFDCCLQSESCGIQLDVLATLYNNLFFVYCSGDPRDLHSFPTRRSSDLCSTSCPRWLRRSSCRRRGTTGTRSEEHTSELQSPYDLVCRLLLEKKKRDTMSQHT